MCVNLHGRDETLMSKTLIGGIIGIRRVTGGVKIPRVRKRKHMCVYLHGRDETLMSSRLIGLVIGIKRGTGGVKKLQIWKEEMHVW